MTIGYRRVDLRGTRDGPLLLALSRESPRVARRLAHGHRVTFSPDTHGWAWSVSDPPLLNRMRWFLREGWGDLPHYGIHAITMRNREARLLLPCTRPTDIDLYLEMAAHSAESLTIAVNDRWVGAMTVETTPATTNLLIPARILFRGDNIIELRRENDDIIGPRLLRLTYSPRTAS
jgi:hypothetical protein